MRELGQKIANTGFDTKGILLPGHGTTPEDLETTTWTEWLDAVKKAFSELRKEYRQIFVCGQSMGGCLGLLLASTQRVDGVIVIASGLRLSHWPARLVPLLKYFVRFKPKLNGPDVKDPEAKEAEIHYSVMPMRSIDELRKLLGELRARISQVECPFMTIHGRHDHTFPFDNQEKLYRSVRSRLRRKIILENSYHLATLDVDKAVLQKAVIHFLKDLCQN